MRKEVKEKALCITADQSQMQRATNHHREAGIGIIPTSRRENKEENMKIEFDGAVSIEVPTDDELSEIYDTVKGTMQQEEALDLMREI